MKIIKYDKARTSSSTSESSSSGGGSYTSIEGGSVTLDRTIWGKHDIGENIDGSMTVNGDVSINVITNSLTDDGDGDGENVELEEGGGNLNVELKTTTNELEVTENAYIQNHLYINYGSDDSHSKNKKCLGELLNNVENNIQDNATEITSIKARVSTNETNIQTNATEITSIKARVSSNETNISTNSTAITSIKSRLSTNETNIANNADEISKLKKAVEDILKMLE